MTELDIKSILNNKNIKSDNFIIKKHNGLYLIKYNKSALNDNNIHTLGLHRSVITDGEKILSFAPPKSVNYNQFIVDNIYNYCNITEFIDGTMINVFYNTSNINENGENEPKWELATRSNIGANCRFNLNSNKTFREMFYEACVPCGTPISDFFNKLNINYSYSFVLQHPENRIVHKIGKPLIYLTNIYESKDKCVNDKHLLYLSDNYKEQHYISDHIKYPRNIKDMYPNVSNWEYINLLCSGEQTGYELQGFVITNDRNERTKIRNIDYEKIKRLRGNSPKLQFQFLELYKNNEVHKYLYYFPENINDIKEYKRVFYRWTEKFYHLYIDCFIEKKKQLKDCPFEYKPLLYYLHKHYLEELKPYNKKVNFTYIKEYIKHIPTEKIMFSMNYKHRTLSKTLNIKPIESQTLQPI
jgi:hypothetical protein